jgi:hypothetical protein
MSKLLPSNFDQLVATAIKKFWTSRTTSKLISQGGARDSVIAGKNMDGFSEIIRSVAQHCGLTDDCIITSGKNI